MKYNLTVKEDFSAAMSKLMKAKHKGKIIDLKEVSPRRSLAQNSYLHLLLGAFGMHFGYTIEESKQLYKEMNPNIYRYEKTSERGVTRVFWKSSADLTKEEMGITIDRFRQISSEQGCYLPEADEHEYLHQISNDMETHFRYL